jgi:hypothetical protein
LPWSPVQAGASHETPGERVHPADRTHNDKMEDELEELGKATDTHSDGDEHGEKQTKDKSRLKKGRKRRGPPSRSPGMDRDKRPRGGGGNGYGVPV